MTAQSVLNGQFYCRLKRTIKGDGRRVVNANHPFKLIIVRGYAKCKKNIFLFHFLRKFWRIFKGKENSCIKKGHPGSLGIIGMPPLISKSKIDITKPPISTTTSISGQSTTSASSSETQSPTIPTSGSAKNFISFNVVILSFSLLLSKFLIFF